MSTAIKKYIIEGLDRLGKSTLINDIQQALGVFQIYHYQKPELLECYREQVAANPEQFTEMIPELGSNHLTAQSREQAINKAARFLYQLESFDNMMQLLEGSQRTILDRAHLGEFVYAPLYRGYEGDYVFALENNYFIDQLDDVRLILLTEDFEKSKHFISDGESFDDSNRQKEQRLFQTAFDRSIISDKRVICVTDPETGAFRSHLEVLKEAIS